MVAGASCRPRSVPGFLNVLCALVAYGFLVLQGSPRPSCRPSAASSNLHSRTDTVDIDTIGNWKQIDPISSQAG